MQGHPESPRLWEQHADAILKSIGFVPTIHEPCLYSGTIEGERVLFQQQVDNFAIAAPSPRIANIVWDMIDDQLSIPLKRQGLVELYNGLDVVQSRHYIKLNCSTYVTRITEKYLVTWMKDMKVCADRPLPFPTTAAFLDELNSSIGDADEKVQEKLKKEYGCGFRNIIGELIYAMVTCRLDISFATVKCA